MLSSLRMCIWCNMGVGENHENICDGLYIYGMLQEKETRIWAKSRTEGMFLLKGIADDLNITILHLLCCHAKYLSLFCKKLMLC